MFNQIPRPENTNINTWPAFVAAKSVVCVALLKCTCTRGGIYYHEASTTRTLLALRCVACFLGWFPPRAGAAEGGEGTWDQAAAERRSAVVGAVGGRVHRRDAGRHGGEAEARRVQPCPGGVAVQQVQA